MPTLLIVHHTPSPAMHSMFEAVREGASDLQIEGVRVVTKAALEATATDVLEADGYVLGTPANLGYISGALKHFFDQVYYPCLDSTVGRQYSAYLHGNDDTTGAVRAIETITTGMKWKRAHEFVEAIGKPTKADLEACWELGAAVAAGLTLD
jgi:multimeric flavodoxin WrbA